MLVLPIFTLFPLPATAIHSKALTETNDFVSTHNLRSRASLSLNFGNYSLSLCVYLCIYLSQISYISIYLSLSLFVLQWSHSIISVISLCIPNHFFPIYLVCSFNLRCILSFFSLFPNLSLYVSFMPLPFATLGTLLRLFFSSVSFCNVYHIQCLLIFSLPVFVKKCSN